MNPYSIDRFAKPFDNGGERLTDIEKMAARAAFSDLVDDVFLAHADEVVVRDETGNDDGISCDYTMDLTEMSAEGEYVSHLEIIVIHGINGKQIQIIEKNKKGVQRTSIYHMTSTAVLRDDTNFNGFLRKPFDIEEGLERLRNDLANWKLEEAMGLNDQPVDREEVAQLRQLLFL